MGSSALRYETLGYYGFQKIFTNYKVLFSVTLKKTVKLDGGILEVQLKQGFCALVNAFISISKMCGN